MSNSDCFKCAYRRGHSAIDPDIVWCENRWSASANYHNIGEEGCKMFKEATKAELEMNAQFDHRNIPVEE